MWEPRFDHHLSMLLNLCAKDQGARSETNKNTVGKSFVISYYTNKNVWYFVAIESIISCIISYQYMCIIVHKEVQ